MRCILIDSAGNVCHNIADISGKNIEIDHGTSLTARAYPARIRRDWRVSEEVV
ncbi:hypothetical protein Rpal_2326 [Rhodopseudomonas palustris TIE-1]|uniref:hypothetical protein n=1 Tax=Rhodopseudomonas sp. AAP120 TaxID=1523430 RepID=UPI000177970E|nr:hypothetical protein [Rhodopseudomonas sp. AAP120]ACF00844.1 hypothetical protein Rpal_2326 [Rhodopseudomonas palustris TIE-1]